MTNKYSGYFKTISVVFDIALLNLCGLAGCVLILGWNVPAEKIHNGLVYFLLINFIWINVTQLTKLYRDLFAKDAIPTIKQSLTSLGLFGFILGFLIVTVTSLQWYNEVLIIPYFLFAFTFLLGKICFLLWRKSSRRRWIDYKPVVILGTDELGIELKNFLDENIIFGYKVIGFFDDTKLNLKDNLKLLGKLSDSIAFAKTNKIKEIFCTLPDTQLSQIKVLMKEADREMIRFKMVPDFKDYFRRNVNIEWYGHMPVLSTRTEPLEIKINQIIKRVFDIVLSLSVILFILSWLTPLLAILIKVSSKGPVFFKQLRSGKNNEPFYCIKFRSMVLNDEADSKQATKNDYRITKIGDFIRRNSIDELPQFINVLKGDMSVIGPRPHMLQHTAAYAALIDQFMVRHLVLPGITGWAQIKGLRGETSDHFVMQKRVEADIWYLENWSLFLDLKIVFLTTFHVLFSKRNAH